MNRISSLVVLVLASLFLLTASSAQAQYRSNDCYVFTTGGVCMVPAAGGIYDTNNFGRYRRSFPMYGDLDWNPYGYYGRYDRNRRFEPVLDACGRELRAKDSRWKQGIATTVGLTVLGGVLGGKTGAVAGAAGGAALSLYNDSKYYSNPDEACGAINAQQVNQDRGRQVPYQEQVTTRPVAGPAANQGSQGGEFELSNQTRVYLEAYDGDQYIGRMAPGDTLRVGPPQKQYRGFALIPNRKGGLSKDELNIEPGNDGWNFVEPKVAQGR